MDISTPESRLTVTEVGLILNPEKNKLAPVTTDKLQTTDDDDLGMSVYQRLSVHSL